MPSKCFRTLILSVAILAAPATSLLAQQSPDPPGNAPFQAGPLVLAPVVQLTNVGHDSNIFNSSENPQGDVTAMFTPSVEGWLRMAHGRISGRTQMDVYYFRTLTNLRGFDNDSSVNVEIPINRVKPYFSGSLTDTRYRQNLEIDALARRRDEAVTAGMDVRVTAKTTAGLFGRRSTLRYQANSVYLNTDLSRVLNHTSRGAGANVRYAVTSLTSLVVEAERATDKFEFQSDRDSENLRVTTGVSFNPRALVSGNAMVGVQRRRFMRNDVAAAATGTYVSVDLNYLLLGRTQFTVVAQRELEYSYLIGQPDYINGGLTLSLNHRISESWEVGGSVGRYRLLYRHDPSATTVRALLGSSDETVLSSSANLAYRLGRGKLGVQVEHWQRLTERSETLRGYKRLRIGSTFTYAF
jgi:Putative beta-barrel porin 2